MPYKSAKQRRYMHAKLPKIAARWDKKYGGKVARSKKKKRWTWLRGFFSDIVCLLEPNPSNGTANG